LAVEEAKLALSSLPEAGIPLDFLETGLSARASRRLFDVAIAEKTLRLLELAKLCIRDAGLKSSDLDTIFFTGGSSQVPAVRAAIARAAPAARLASGSDFLSVASGLTREAERLFR